MFARHLRYWKRWKLATFRRFAWTRKIVYDKYTGFFGTRQEPQKFIKFSAFSGIYFYKVSPIYRERGPQKILLYFWGANEQKTNKWIKRVCLVKSEICDAYAPSWELAKNPKNSSNFRILRVYFLQILAVLRKIDIIRFSAFSGIYFFKFSPIYRESFLCHSEEWSDVRIPRKRTLFFNVVSLPGDCHATLAMTISALHEK